MNFSNETQTLVGEIFNGLPDENVFIIFGDILSLVKSYHEKKFSTKCCMPKSLGYFLNDFDFPFSKQIYQCIFS